MTECGLAQRRARRLVEATGMPVSVYRHTGGDVGDWRVPARGTYIVRPDTLRAPLPQLWTRVETVCPADVPIENGGLNA